VSTPLTLAKGSKSDPEAVGRTLTDTLLKARETLPLAANGQHVCLSDPYAAKVAKEMAQGRSQEFKRIWAVCQGMLADGVSLPLVTAALRQMLTMLEVEAVTLTALRRETTPRVLPVLLRRETRKQGDLDLAQLRVLEAPHCPNTLSAALFAGEQYLSAYDAWGRAIVGLLHELQHQPKRHQMSVLR
jgi:hypothetical protein